jgi:hypothetical protein
VQCSTEIVATDPYPGRPDLGLLRTVLRGFKMERKDGEFVRVDIFELERELAVKRRSHYA